jgi:hypothetical protein
MVFQNPLLLTCDIDVRLWETTRRPRARHYRDFDVLHLFDFAATAEVPGEVAAKNVLLMSIQTLPVDGPPPRN